MKFKLIGLVFVVFLTLGNVSAQQAPPEFPDLFYGEVTVNGDDAPAGEKIVAKVGGELPDQGNITIDTAGKYGSSDGAEEQLAVADSSTGEDISFFIQEYDGNLVQASSLTPEVDYRSEGDIRNVNLSFQNVELTEPSDGGSSLSVDVEDVSVDEGSSVDLEYSVSDEGSNPDYSWSIVGDDYGSSISDSESADAVFDAPSSVSEDREVEVELEVTKDGGSGSSETGSGTVTVLDSTESGSSGGAPSDDQQDLEDEDDQQDDDQQDQDNQQDQQDQQEEENQQDQGRVDREVSANVDEESGEASSEVDAGEGERVRTSIPESVDSDGSRVESIEFSSSSDQTVSTTVREVEDDSELEDQGIERTESQIGVQEISVEGDVENSTITFSVSKDVLEERDASPEDVVKQRYDSEAQEWQDLETSHLEELSDRHRFEADVPEFSYFATSIETGEDGGIPWMYLGVIAVLLVILGITVYKYERLREAFETQEVSSPDIEVVGTEDEIEQTFEDAAEALRNAAEDIDQAADIVEEALDEGSDAEDIEALVEDVVDEEDDAIELMDHIKRIEED